MVDFLLNFVTNMSTKYPMLLLALSVVGTLPPLASTYVALTPNKEDDIWLKKVEDKPMVGALLRFFVRFSLVERKEIPATIDMTEKK